MGLLEIRQLVFQAGQLGTQLVRLLGEELGGFVGPFGTLLEVLVEEQRDQLVGNFLGHLRLLVLEGHIERHGRFATPAYIGGEGFDHDGTAHVVDLVAIAEALVGEQVVLVDDAQQVLAGHHPLANHFDAFIGEAGVVGRYQLGGNLLRLHQDGAGRLVDRRHHHCNSDGRGQDDYDAHPQQQGPVLDYGDVISEGELVVGLHGATCLKFRCRGTCTSTSNPRS
ncbi:hypothetical protein D3C78_512960 [compost metagenome]